MSNLTVLGGDPHRLGATITDNGVNFAIFSRDAVRVLICFFEK